ncbi:MAG TPA: sulfotransferase domain-containing protein [Pseudolabrys sp.]|nr:sulfotransferase domain-containing protein [Pseudolabrys sp.]
MGRVDFFIAGVQKAGTTALDNYLRRHPSIQMARIKEVHFFDDEALNWSEPDFTRLHQAFDWTAPGKLRGEATPIYTYWPNALTRIRQYNPAAKLIMLLRHPSLRAHSHWRMEAKRGRDNLPFAEAVSAAGRARVTAAPSGAHRVFSYVERGYYAAQIRELLRLFPRRQLLFCRTDRLWNDQPAVLAQVQEFLGLERRGRTDRYYCAPVLTWSPDGIPATTRARLDAIFADDIRGTAELAGLDLGDWLNPNYREPMMPG